VPVNRPPPVTSIGPAQVSPATPPPELQVPSTHDWPVPQAVPQAPQLLRSDMVSTQYPPHASVPDGQLTVHVLSTHASAPVQPLPQVPQFAGSMRVSTHVPEHSSRPEGHSQVPNQHC
jgi:hypothetical protein